MWEGRVGEGGEFPPGGRLLSNVMRRGILGAGLLSLLLLAGCTPEPPPTPPEAPTVVLLHGLGRTSFSMAPMEEHLGAAGYRVINLGYPSREEPPADLVAHLGDELGRCCAEAGRPVHFVTHSLGGILVRLLAEEPELPIEIGRVVMLSPPNQGSEIVDTLEDNPLAETVMGPTFERLGTGEDSLPARLNRLGPVPFELGVIAGNRTLEPHLSWLIPGEDDGKVAVERAKVAGMADFLVVPATHPFIMGNPEVMAQVVNFLETGTFVHAPDEGTEPVAPRPP